MSPRRRRWLTSAAVAAMALAAVFIFVAITAAHAETPDGATVALPLPSLGSVIETLIAVMIEEMLRRGLRKVDAIGVKCDETHAQLSQFQTRIDGALLGIDGRGGMVNEIRDLQEELARIQEARRTGTSRVLGPKDVGTLEPRGS